MGLGRADSNSHQVLATGNGALVLHPFAVPRGLGACAPCRRAVSVAPSPVLGPVVSGARLSLSAGPTSQAPNLSREESTNAPNPVVARHAAAASPWRRYPDQTHLRPAYADRGDHSRPQEPPIRVRAAVCANEVPQAPRSSAAHRCTGFIHSVGAGSCRRRPRHWARHFQVNTERRRPCRRRCFSIRISEVCAMYRAHESRCDRLRAMTFHMANLHEKASDISLSGRFACYSLFRPCRTLPLFGRSKTGGTRV